jgi:hypothetical protein
MGRTADSTPIRRQTIPENDNLIGMYRNGGDVKVDGEVRNVWTQKVFQKMIENNNKIISSPELV